MPLLDAAKDTKAACAGADCRSIFGYKHKALSWLSRHGDDLWHELEYLHHEGASNMIMSGVRD
jgi:hypothetical protein